MSRLSSILVVIAAILFFAPARAAWGAQVDVSPVRLHLSGARRSQSVELHNRSAEKVRYQVTSHAWKQAPDGRMELSPTEDLVVFPTLLEIAPGQTRRIKVATLARPGLVERSYRIFVAELPTGPDPTAGIRVLTRFGIPVFLQPRTPAPKPTVSVRVERGRLIVAVANAGSSYFVAREVRVVGRAANGRTVLDEKLPGWYVLARGERRYELTLSPEACRALATLSAKVATESSVAQTSGEVLAGSCGP